MPLTGGGASPSTRLKRSDGDDGLRVAAVLVVLSLTLFTFSMREGTGGGPLSTVRGVWMTLTTPVRWAGAAVAAPFEGLGNIFENLTADQELLSDLRAQNEALVARNAELEEAQQTAARLESILGLQTVYKLESTAARIISGSTDSWNSTVIIDKGSTSGLAVGMPVTNASGAIGQIIECGPTSATVRLISDENSSISAMVQSSRAHGVLRGSADRSLRLTLVRTDQTVSVNDIVVTSGLGGVFPKGLPIGKVSSAERASGSLYYEIEVEPLSTTESFEEVLVITSLTAEQQATEEEVAEADAQDATATQVVKEDTSNQVNSIDNAQSNAYSDPEQTSEEEQYYGEE